MIEAFPFSSMIHGWTFSHVTGVTAVGVVPLSKGPEPLIEARINFAWGTSIEAVLPFYMVPVEFGTVDTLRLVELVVRRSVKPKVEYKVSRNAVYVGGDLNGKVASVVGKIRRIPKISLLSTSLNDYESALYAPTMEDEYYYLEQVARGVYSYPAGEKLYYADVYRHESVPQHDSAKMLEACLEEFPLLRTYPDFCDFWYDWKELK